jgi:hypothetical protein
LLVCWLLFIQLWSLEREAHCDHFTSLSNPHYYYYCNNNFFG